MTYSSVVSTNKLIRGDGPIHGLLEPRGLYSCEQLEICVQQAELAFIRYFCGLCLLRFVGEDHQAKSLGVSRLGSIEDGLNNLCKFVTNISYPPKFLIYSC